MRKTLAVLILSMAALPAWAAHPVEGEWSAPDNSSRMRIAPCANAPAQLCGTMTYIKPRPPSATPPKGKDGKVIDQKAMREAMLDKPMIVGLKPGNGTKWKDGRIEFPGSDMKIKASIELNKDGTLKLSGCVAVLCGGQNWKRYAA